MKTMKKSKIGYVNKDWIKSFYFDSEMLRVPHVWKKKNDYTPTKIKITIEVE